MKDVNFPLQKAYLAALGGITYDDVEVPAYFKQLPDNINPNNYIIFEHVSNGDISTMNSSDTGSLMRVTVHTFSDKYNTGKAAGFIGGQVLNRIYPNGQTNLDLSADGLQCVSTQLFSDLPQDYGLSSRVYLDRIFIFSHKIYHLS